MRFLATDVASSTSSWQSGFDEMPAARFETSATPATFMPQACANTASGTVLIPTTSAPMRPYARISAGVSNTGPAVNA